MLDVLHLTVKRFTFARRGRQALPTAEGRMHEGRQRSFKAADAWCFFMFFHVFSGDPWKLIPVILGD